MRKGINYTPFELLYFANYQFCWENRRVFLLFSDACGNKKDSRIWIIFVRFNDFLARFQVHGIFQNKALCFWYTWKKRKWRDKIKRKIFQFCVADLLRGGKKENGYNQKVVCRSITFFYVQGTEKCAKGVCWFWFQKILIDALNCKRIYLIRLYYVLQCRHVFVTTRATTITSATTSSDLFIIVLAFLPCWKFFAAPGTIQASIFR